MTDGVKTACNERLLKLSDAIVMCMDGDQWRDFVKGTVGSENVECITKDAFGAKQRTKSCMPLH